MARGSGRLSSIEWSRKQQRADASDDPTRASRAHLPQPGAAGKPAKAAELNGNKGKSFGRRQQSRRKSRKKEISAA